MGQEGQPLPLRLAAGQDLNRVHARLDELRRDPARDRRDLLGHVNRTPAATADLVEELVGTNPGSRAFSGGPGSRFNRGIGGSEDPGDLRLDSRV